MHIGKSNISSKIYRYLVRGYFDCKLLKCHELLVLAHIKTASSTERKCHCQVCHIDILKSPPRKKRNLNSLFPIDLAMGAGSWALVAVLGSVTTSDTGCLLLIRDLFQRGFSEPHPPDLRLGQS